MNFFAKKYSGTLHRLVTDQEGATATEYGVILGAIVVVVIAAVALFGIQFSSTTSAVYSGLSNGTDAAAGSFGPGTFRTQTGVTIP